MRQIFSEVKRGKLGLLNLQVFSEKDLRIIANSINRDPRKAQIIKELITSIPKFGRKFDWNVGSILQHLEPRLIIEVLEQNEDVELMNSIGLAWALGELKNTSRIVTDFLFKIVTNTTNSDAWWRAAFSLEKLGLVEAVNFLKMSLKSDHPKDLDYYLEHIYDKKSIIDILILSNVENIEKIIYPRIKKIFLSAKEDLAIINCCWLIGRLRLIDFEIYSKLLQLISHNNYELRYYTFFALQNNANESLRSILERTLKDIDPLIRKMAARGLMSIGNEESLTSLRQALYKENEETVVAELSKTIYYLRNPIDKALHLLEIQSYRNENGMICDESDKWYRDPSIYHIFSEAEDPENICFSLIQERIKDLLIKNPIDLATGTGRIIWQMIDKIDFKGSIFAVDASEQMCDFIKKTIKRERKFISNIKIVNSTIVNSPNNIPQKSSLIISSFGFPSRISDSKQCLAELKAVHDLLDDDGLFFTIGWDETFNDELSQMWFKFIPDKISAYDFEEWRRKRASAIMSPRNTGLKWFKKGIYAPLQFSSLKEAVFVMGYLFGRDAAQYVIHSGKTEWSMSLGITCNTKKELEKYIQSYERS